MTKLLSLLLVLCSLALSVEANAEQWLYRNPLMPKQIFSIESNPDSYGFDDLRFEAKLCKKSSMYHCIISEKFEFFVPKTIDKLTEHWSQNDKTYRILSTNKANYLGILNDIFVIERIDGSLKIRFLYSKSRGLIGLGEISKVSSGFYLLDSKCGFGAPVGCKTQLESKRSM